MLLEKYNHKEREKFWQNYWREHKIFAWKNDLPREKTFVIDTPPPTVSGVLHMGHVFSYTQADFVARFQRMQGKDVFYPMGFDDNGLPTERLVEKIIDKKAGIYEKENGHGSFVAKCREIVESAEKEYEDLFNAIALSVDWSQKYQTISPESQKISQASFIDLYRKGHVERKFEPVFWDVSDRTALAQADLVDKEMDGVMNFIRFGLESCSPSPKSQATSTLPQGEGDYIEIMTTRPELLPACVAVMVHPEDSRYKHLHGAHAITPIFGVRVPIIADEDVQMDKGTGAVMCCTFGDETDIKWWRKYQIQYYLQLRVIINEDGTISGYAIANDNKLLFDATIKYSDNIYLGYIDKKDCVDFENLKNIYSRIVGKKLKEAKDIIVEMLKGANNHPPLEGGSKSLTTSGRGIEHLYSQEALEKAKQLRQNQTDAEGLLWHYLRNKQLNEYKFRRQQPIEKYIVDFICFEKKLIIELDGSQHNKESAKIYDEKRGEFLKQSGFKILRFWNEDIFKNMEGVLWVILNALEEDESCRPSPKSQATSTLPQGEGDLHPLLTKQEPIKRSVKCAERSGMPIEILIMPQWFVKILDKKDALKQKVQECNWFPGYMQVRIEQWIDGLSWDWCISRQRFFGVKFPIWYSKRKGEEGKILVASADQLPCDPLTDLPKGYSREEVDAETDIMDTWATSSISPQLSSKGISAEILFDKERHAKLFPADLRPQAHEIIRTWAFYTIAKALLHENVAPWKNLMISGWCLAADKTKMSKSKGNVVTPTALIEEKGSDIVRYFASTSHLGADTAYSEDVFKIGQKLLTKLFNAAKFVTFMSANYSDADKSFIDDPKSITEKADLWILAKLNSAINKATEEFEKFEYARAREKIEDFFWHDFCDNYLEIVKVRAYGLNAEKLKDVALNDQQKNEITQKQKSAIATLYLSLNGLLKLFAPFLPHICEEIYQAIFADEARAKKSIHARQNWVDATRYPHNQNAVEAGEKALEIIFAVRKFKSDNNLSMKTSFKKIKIGAPKKDGLSQKLNAMVEDIKNVCNSDEIEFFDAENFVVNVI